MELSKAQHNEASGKIAVLADQAQNYSLPKCHRSLWMGAVVLLIWREPEPIPSSRQTQQPGSLRVGGAGCLENRKGKELVDIGRSASEKVVE